jgi:hypothetical protein
MDRVSVGPSKSYLIFGFGGKVYALIRLMSGWSGIPGIFKEAGRQMLLGSTEMLLETIKGEGIVVCCGYWVEGFSLPRRGISEMLKPLAPPFMLLLLECITVDGDVVKCC